uniref:Amino-acid acetyltransferase n=1 Tax=Candidatus Kentrum sp. FM TaxID=2126340 RepID=A0A450SAR8_9GAMM|nr:MAG: amino-acid N-acetyltransferase [Candidatus Kentron sp. FM]VFJ49217.1 MAG: amino-acid N-acetyltransferase [Candidatus Kentron sp. FM]VFK11354.1 MAG: amino-acid N-acetyltransferase [Candidatus Kentron sp. FM]
MSLTKSVSITNQDIVTWFRNAAPYIKSQRDNIFVIYFSGEVIADTGRFPGLIADFVLLHSLGVKLVLVHGARPQIQQRLHGRGVPVQYADGSSIIDEAIIDEAAMAIVKEAIAATRLDIEARLSMEPVNNTPMANATGGNNSRVRVASGNFVIGRPIGVRAGVDFGYRGEVRRVEVAAIRTLLDGGHIVLISPVGFSPTGEIFNLSAPDVASRVAESLPADKLLLLSGESTMPRDRIPGQITLFQAKSLLAEYWAEYRGKYPAEYREANEERAFYRHLERAVQVCRSGVRRVHFMDYRIDGALLLEIYTRDGVGSMVCSDSYDTMRRATVDDIAGIIKLIAPLEEQGILTRRSREKLEAEIDCFLVMERDGTIIACVAAYPCVDEQCMDEQEERCAGEHESPLKMNRVKTNGGKMGGEQANMLELACLAVHRDYRNAECGNALLNAIEKEAETQGATHLFVLTTHTEHWFLEHGFSRATLNDLPRSRQRMYNEDRNAKVLIKAISH